MKERTEKKVNKLGLKHYVIIKKDVIIELSVFNHFAQSFLESR